MILYLDTSALVKAYVSEQYSDMVLDVMEDANIVASHRIAFIEAHAAFARLLRENKLAELEVNALKEIFRNDWVNFCQIENNHELMMYAVELVEAFALRAYDSVHLAAAVLLSKQSIEPLIFACFDQHLNKAAKILGLQQLV